MATPLEAWRDTLRELGVMGLVRPEAMEASGSRELPVGVPGAETGSPRPEAPAAPPKRPPPPREAPPATRPFSPPTDAIGCPPPEAVAGASTLRDLEAAIRGCLKCPLGPGRISFVFGEGDPGAGLMFIGEGPGRDEDLQGRPFVGKAGELLDKMIGGLGLTRAQVYIANVVKCRPPDNRTPFPEESQACLGYLRRQIELIQPKVIVTLGATPLRELLAVKEGITKVRGQWQRLELGGRVLPVMPTFHPAYVLRQYTQEVRRAVWEDLKSAKGELDRA